MRLKKSASRFLADKKNRWLLSKKISLELYVNNQYKQLAQTEMMRKKQFRFAVSLFKSVWYGENYQKSYWEVLQKELSKELL